MERVEVITSVERRRRFAADEKRAMVEKAEQPGMSISIVARKYGINPSQVFRWRKLMEQGALVAAGLPTRCFWWTCSHKTDHLIVLVFWQNKQGGFCHEKVEVYGGADRLCAQTG